MQQTFTRKWSAALVLPLALAACEKKKAAPPPAPDAPTVAAPAAKPAESDTVLVGEIFSFTGALAVYGISARNGIAVRVEEINSDGGINGKQIELRGYDDNSKSEDAASAVKRLVTQDKVVAILGAITSGNTLAMAPIAQAAKTPMITPTATAVEVTKAGDYVFRTCFIDPFQGSAMGKFARENLKLTTAAVITDSKSPYAVGLTEFFTKKFTELGGKVVAQESFAQGDTDFRAQLTKMKKTKAQALYIPAYAEDVARIAEQARELGFKPVKLGSDGWDSQKLFELAKSAVEGSYFTAHYSPEDPDPIVQNFIAAYKAKNASVPDSLAALGYDAAGVLFDAMKRAPNLSPEALRDAIAATKGFKGVTGSITFDADRNPVKPAAVLQVTNGAFKFKTKVEP